jgi:uncharacterized membrane protein YhdT
MKSNYNRYIKPSVKFVSLLILYYLVLYFVSRFSLSVIIGTYDLSIGYDLGCHAFAFLFLIISFITHGNNDNNTNTA